jgi:hypothetical protein
MLLKKNVVYRYNKILMNNSMKEETLLVLINKLHDKIVEKVKEDVLDQLNNEVPELPEVPTHIPEVPIPEPEPEPPLEVPEPEIPVEEPVPEPEIPVAEPEIPVAEPVPEPEIPVAEPVPEPEIPIVEEIPDVDGYKYAKRQKPVQGSKKLCVIGLKWNNTNKSASSGECKSVGNVIKNFYLKNSNKLLNFQVSSHVVSVPYAGNKGNLNKAENYAKSKYKGFDYYAILSSLNAIQGSGNSNAGGNTAHLRGNSSRTASHEIGHLLGLGHSGAYKNGGKLDYYGDGYSVMSSIPSGALTVPQYYKLGWFGPKDVAIYEEDKPEKTYTLRKVNNFDKNDGLAGVKVITGDTRDAWVSIIKPNNSKPDVLAMVLHLSSGGSSQRIKMFGNEYTDDRFTGLTIKKISQKDGLVTISISNTKSKSKSKSMVMDEWNSKDVHDGSECLCECSCECPDEECKCVEN